MKKILITTPWFYPAYKAGGPVLSIVNMVNALSEEYEFFIFTSDADLNDEELRGIKKDQWLQYNPHTKVWYATKGNRSNNLYEEVKRLSPDVIYIIGIYDWHFNLVPWFFCNAPIKVISTRGMLHPGALSQKRLKKRIYVEVLKLLSRNKKVMFHATDEMERNFITDRMGPGNAIKVAGNFPRMIEKRGSYVKDADRLKLVTVALISPMKNHLQILKALAQSDKNIRYSIYGPVKDAAYWKLCVDQMALLPPNIEANYYGDIQPQLIPGKLYENDVFIMPSESENYGHSIVEALYAGLPVITSMNTPWNNLRQNKAGENVAVSEEQILDAVHFFLQMSNDTYQDWSAGASLYAQSKVDHGKLEKDYRDLFS